MVDRPGDELRRLAAELLNRLHASLTDLPARLEMVVLIEAARVVDQFHLWEAFESQASDHEIVECELIYRGWNQLLAFLMARQVPASGFPIQTSTSETRENLRATLRSFGLHTLLVKTADMVDAGIYVTSKVGDEITVSMAPMDHSDFFLDQLEAGRLRAALGPAEDALKAWTLDPEERERLLAEMIFPWIIPQGHMVGYNAHPALDAHFLALSSTRGKDLRDLAGIHPDTDFGSFSGSDLSLVIMLLISGATKHIALVQHAKKVFPDTNISMSTTIWKPREQLIQEISDHGDFEPNKIARIVDALTFSRDDCDLVHTMDMPFVPLMIKISDEYLLLPVAGGLSDAFRVARLMLERRDARVVDAIRSRREAWMLEDLNALFQGNRYQTIEQPVLLRRNKKIVTDLDGAILDNTTGELSLFQLKWQDFGTADVRRHRSRAGNFTTEVDSWATKVKSWIDEYSGEHLLRLLGFRYPKGRSPSRIRLFAIGRTAARFRSIGFVPTTNDLALATWSQFVRLRHQIGPANNVLESLHEHIVAEAQGNPKRRMIPISMTVGDSNITLKDVWHGFDDGTEPE